MFSETACSACKWLSESRVYQSRSAMIRNRSLRAVASAFSVLFTKLLGFACACFFGRFGRTFESRQDFSFGQEPILNRVGVKALSPAFFSEEIGPCGDGVRSEFKLKKSFFGEKFQWRDFAPWSG